MAPGSDHAASGCSNPLGFIIATVKTATVITATAKIATVSKQRLCHNSDCHNITTSPGLFLSKYLFKILAKIIHSCCYDTVAIMTVAVLTSRYPARQSYVTRWNAATVVSGLAAF